MSESKECECESLRKQVEDLKYKNETLLRKIERVESATQYQISRFMSTSIERGDWRGYEG